MWKKVLYIGIVLIFGFIIYVIGYNSNQMNHLESLVKQAIENERFYEVPMIWDGCFDTKSIIDNDSDNLDIVIYPATSQTDVTYGANNERFIKYEESYYLYMFNTKFSLDSVSTGSNTSYNRSGIVFSNGGNVYTYYFIVDESQNSSSYIENPTTKEEALLNASRDVTSTNSYWNFMRVTLTETMLTQISNELGGNIEKISIQDSEGISQYTSNVDLSFSQKFFSDMKPLFDNYNLYLDSYIAADGNNDEINAAQEKFNTFYDSWFEEFESQKDETGYTFRFDNNVLTPSKIMWQSIGIIAIYFVVVAILYILLFHFKSIRKIFSKDTYKKHPANSKILVNGKWVDRSKARSSSKSMSANASEIEEPKLVTDEEDIETVTAGVLVSNAILEESQEDHSNDAQVEESSAPTREIKNDVEESLETKEQKEEAEAKSDETPTDVKPKKTTRKTKTTKENNNESN